MISSTIRAYSIQGGKKPNIFLYQNTTTGLFYISDVEAEITEELIPLEQLCMELIDKLGSITRIEAHAFSGISLDICQETLQGLQYHGLLKLQDYEVEQLHNNVELLKSQLGEDWFTPAISSLTDRKLLKQYQLSEEGKKATKTRMKTVRKNSELDLVITGSPFYVFNEKMDLKSDGYELIEMNRNLIHDILTHAKNYAEYSGVKPLSIGSSSVTEGKEVSNAQFWITLEGAADTHLDDAKYDMYLSSKSFERWTNPPWNKELENLVPDIEYIEDVVIKAMSETWMMVEDVIKEGLELDQDGVTWILSADLEMQKLIFNVMKEPINEFQPEIKLRLPNSDWKVVILLQLEAWDELAEKSLRAGRFHAQVTRKGFTQEEGFLTYQEMMQKRDKPVKRQEYLDTLELLVEYNCLIKREPKVTSVVVDVDDILSKNRRGSQKWEFNRLREVENILDQHGVTDVRFLATKRAQTKVDEDEKLTDWLEEGKIEIIDNFEQEVPEVIDEARKSKSHYIGSKSMSKKNQDHEYSRTLKFKVSKKRLSIPGLEPFYDWRLENLFEKMYQVYYE